MRTTLTLDPDVAARLKRLSQGGRFKDVVNEALRRGLERLESKEPRRPYRIRAVKGEPRRTDLDNIGEVLAEIEGDDYR
jgi:Arc/MetJ-type ribon-helix-helix transcriptional regulator